MINLNYIDDYHDEAYLQEKDYHPGMPKEIIDKIVSYGEDFNDFKFINKAFNKSTLPYCDVFNKILDVVNKNLDHSVYHPSTCMYSDYDPNKEAKNKIEKSINVGLININIKSNTVNVLPSNWIKSFSPYYNDCECVYTNSVTISTLSDSEIIKKAIDSANIKITQLIIDKEKEIRKIRM